MRKLKVYKAIYEKDSQGRVTYADLKPFGASHTLQPGNLDKQYREAKQFVKKFKLPVASMNVTAEGDLKIILKSVVPTGKRQVGWVRKGTTKTVKRKWR